jgi:photosynthetic reaction center H subunit
MSTGGITGYFDVAQVTLYAFWIFFFGLVVYLRREDKREGYPLESDDQTPRQNIQGFPAIPKPKTFLLPHGGTVQAPRVEAASREAMNAAPIAAWPGAPLEPTGNNLLLAGVGPGSYANRADEPDLTIDGFPKIVPLRADSEYSVDPRDPDPRGKNVFGADRRAGGVVCDIWVDRSERLFRYFELEVQAPAGPRRVLVPVNFCKVNGDGTVKVNAILSRQFADVPGLRNPDQVTLLEEDRIAAYYGAGYLYATPARREPLL